MYILIYTGSKRSVNSFTLCMYVFLKLITYKFYVMLLSVRVEIIYNMYVCITVVGEGWRGGILPGCKQVIVGMLYVCIHIHTG